MTLLQSRKAEAPSKDKLARKALKWNRKLHRWLSVAIAIPMLFIILTGIFLQVRKPVDWIQPPTLKGSQSYDPTISLERVLEQVQTVPEMGINSWQDIKLLDLRPKKGIIKVRNTNELETQVDASTGEILQTAQRRNDVVVKMHDFSAWHARLWLGLPVRLAFLGIFLTGVYLMVKMTLAKLRVAGKKRSVPPQVNVNSNNGIISEANESTPNKSDSRPPRLRLKAWMLKYHYWFGWVVIIPWAFVIASGLLLQVRYEVSWVMPPLQQGQGTTPTVEFVQALETAQQIPEEGITEWKDVWRMYVYPKQGVTTIRGKNRQEVQIDSTSGDILQVATRRTDWLEDIHEGKWNDLNLWLFLPVHILSLILWLTGTVVAYSR